MDRGPGGPSLKEASAAAGRKTKGCRLLGLIFHMVLDGTRTFAFVLGGVIQARAALHAFHLLGAYAKRSDVQPSYRTYGTGVYGGGAASSTGSGHWGVATARRELYSLRGPEAVQVEATPQHDTDLETRRRDIATRGLGAVECVRSGA